MRLRRAAGLLFDPQESAGFDLDALLAGCDGLRLVRRWVVYAPHRDAELEIGEDELLALGRLSETRWVDRATLDAEFGADTLERLCAKGLLVAESGAGACPREARFRERHWRKLAAAAHYFTRWRGMDAENPADGKAMRSLNELIAHFGPPPPATLRHATVAQALPLAAPAPDARDALRHRRATCRNFDTAAALDAARFARVLHTVFAAQGSAELAPGSLFLKKNTPSGGGLHPIEAYLIVRAVAGIPPGLYHYLPLEHALEPVGNAPADLHRFATAAVAGQQWFGDAPVLVALTARFARTYWKYRDHPKAYRAIVLEVGHLAQMLQLTATEVGLGAFVTAAINERDLEAAFGLDPLDESPIAVCGFGPRATRRVTVEFDPLHAVWPAPAEPAG